MRATRGDGGWARAGVAALCAAAALAAACGCELLDLAQGTEAEFVVENGGAIAVDIYLDNALLGTARPLEAATWKIPAGTHVVRGDGRPAGGGRDYDPGPFTFEAHGGEEWHWHIGDFTGTPYLDVY